MKKILLLASFFLLHYAAEAKDFNIISYGAVSDTAKLSTVAIQKAIDECNASGGGRVVIPSGNFKTGSLILKSNVNLYLEHGSTLYGSTDLKDYIKLKSEYLSLRTQTSTIQLIYADGVENVKISGSGCIDGRGKSFKKLSYTDEGITRPHLLRFIQSKDVTVEGITLRNSGCWMQHYLACDRLYISGIKVFNRNNYNNDALDLDGCHDVVVSDMIADSDDDAITLKSTSPRKCENITISNCVVSSHCNAIKLGTETNGGFRNINIHGIVVKPSENQESHFYGRKNGTSAISLEIVDGGTLENVIVSGITVMETESPIFIRLGNRARGYYDGQKIDNVGNIRNVILSDIQVINAGVTGSSITGLPGHPVEDITLSNIRIVHQGGSKKVDVPSDEKEKEYPEATMWGPLPAQGFFIRHARNVKLNNIEVTSLNDDERPLFVKEDVE